MIKHTFLVLSLGFCFPRKNIKFNSKVKNLSCFAFFLPSFFSRCVDFLSACLTFVSCPHHLWLNMFSSLHASHFLISHSNCYVPLLLHFLTWTQQLHKFFAFYLLLLHIVLFLCVLYSAWLCLVSVLLCVISFFLSVFLLFSIPNCFHVSCILVLSACPTFWIFSVFFFLFSILFPFLSLSMPALVCCASQCPWCAQRTLLPLIVLPPSCVNMPVIWVAPPCAENQVEGWRGKEPYWACRGLDLWV